jgi:GT2 family glycosyltransferase
VSPEVTVVIVNFNSGAEAAACLASAAADLAGRDWDAIVVDNASAPGDLDPLAGGPARIVRNGTNVGFGAAVNAAARLSAARFLWLLNPDCLVLPGAYTALCEDLAADAARALAAPTLLNDDGSVQASARGEPSASTGLFGRHTLLTRYFPRAAAARRNLPAQDLVDGLPDGADVDWVMGAAMLLRRDRFDEVRGFDEQYFLYWEDADFCRRLRDRHFRIRYVPRARVRHSGGVSAASASALATRAFHRGAYRYYATHVARHWWSPARLAARAALAIRCRWRLWRQ